MKKVIVVGASGVLGSAVAKGLDRDYQVIRAGRSGSDLKVDAGDLASLEEALASVRPFDGLISCIGHVPFDPFEEVSMEAFADGITNKFLYQAKLLRAALPHLKQGGSVTFTSGILADEPLIGSACAAAANGALHGFVMAVSAELLGRARVNVVSPSVVEDAVEKFGDFFDGFEATSMESLVIAYRRCLAGPITGKILRI